MKKLICLALAITMLYSTAFASAPSDWATEYILSAREIGIVEKDSKYDYQSDITREAFCELIYRLMNKLNYFDNWYNAQPKPVAPFAKPPFEDTDNEKVYDLYNHNIIYGKTDTEFAPNDSLTREEAAVILHRVYSCLIPETTANDDIKTSIMSHMSATKFYDEEDFSDWAVTAIYNMRSYRIMNGVEEHIFDPKGTYTIEQAITTIVRLYEKYVRQIKFVDCNDDVILDSTHISGCTTYESNMNYSYDSKYVIELTLTEEGQKRFSEATERISEYSISEKYISIYVNDKLISSPSVMETINSSSIVISSDLTKEGTESLMEEINLCIGKTEAEKSFAVKINEEMPDDTNYLFSPLSIKLALALTANGANGDTKEEILNTTGISDLDLFNTYAQEVMEKYSKSDELTLKIANSIWVKEGSTKYTDTFQKLADEYYKAEADTFNNQNALNKINGWVKEQTNGNITNIIDSADFDAALINAIYFHGEWQSQFSEEDTKPDKFINYDETISEIEFMNKTKTYSYCNTGTAEIIEMPYDNYTTSEEDDPLDISMYFILCDKETDVVNELDFAIANDKFDYRKVELSIPKFEFEYNMNLNEALNNLGIITAFTPSSADFGEMFNSSEMYIDNTIHKTYINVNERGTEAAGATAISFTLAATPPEEPVILKFNRPFTFVIRDNTNGEILFMGRFVKAE